MCWFFSPGHWLQKSIEIHYKTTWGPGATTESSHAREIDTVRKVSSLFEYLCSATLMQHYLKLGNTNDLTWCSIFIMSSVLSCTNCKRWDSYYFNGESLYGILYFSRLKIQYDSLLHEEKEQSEFIEHFVQQK